MSGRAMAGAEIARDKRIRAMSDIALLDALVADVDVTEDERKAFGEMAGLIRSGDRATLSKKQRAWAEEVKRRVTPLLASDAPRGREVPTPEVLRKLPLKPPGR